MGLRCFGWPRARRRLDGVGPILDDSVIVPNTPIDEVGAFVDTPQKLVAWFGVDLDIDHATLTISRAPSTVTIAWIDSETIDHDRSRTFSGAIAAGPVHSFFSLRSVVCRTDAESQAATPGYGTEIRTHIELPQGTPRSVVTTLHDVIRSGNQHLRSELGT